MKLTRDDNPSIQRIERYAPGRISVNGMTHNGPIIVSPTLVIRWEICGITALSAENFSEILRLNPEIILLGSGTRQHFPSGSLLSEISRQGVGIEVMDTAAACRTYNLLASEERRVVAALLPIEIE